MSREELGNAAADVEDLTPLLLDRSGAPPHALPPILLPLPSPGAADSLAFRADPPPAGTDPAGDLTPDLTPDPAADLTPDGGTGAAPAAALAVPGGTPSERAPARAGFVGRRARVGLLALVVLLAGLAGFTGGRLWAGTQDGAGSLDGPVAWAVIVAARPGGGVARTVIDLTVRVTNLSGSALMVTGAESSFDAGAIEAVTPDGLSIPAGGVADVGVHASVDCSSTQPLRLYPLQVRRGDRSLHTVAVSGATSALARACESQPEPVHVLLLDKIATDDGQLRLSLRSPTGRTTQIVAVRAGGVPLNARPLRGAFDGRARTIWIQQPGTCPVEWLRAGLPRTVVVDIDAGGPATLTFDVGFTFARWLRGGTCPGTGS